MSNMYKFNKKCSILVTRTDDMLKINMEFSKGILWIRLDGILNKTTSNTFDDEVIPVILKHGIKYVVVNLDKVNVIDLKGIESLISLNEVVRSMNGKTTLCSLSNRKVKNILNKSEYNNTFYETSNELTALGVMKI